MSFTGKDRNVRSKSGKVLPGGGEPSQAFATIVALALHREFGVSPAAVKSVANLANANERAVKNWFDAKNAPNGVYLVRLLEHSDEVLESVLKLAGRRDLLIAKKVRDARSELRELLLELDRLLSD
jgi:hypothetical protein